MQSLDVIWRWLLLLSIFGFGQLLGILFYVRLKRFSYRLAHVVGVIIPAALFFYLAPILFFSGLREAQARHEVVCGLQVLAGLIMTFVGTALQLLFGAGVQLYLYRRS